MGNGMEVDSPTWSAITLSAMILFFIVLLRRNSKAGGRRPPGPPGWPVIGNMLDLGDMPHRTFLKLRSQYGPVLWLKLGSVNTMVVQSAEAAEELFKNHDLAFADRKSPDALTSHEFNELGIAMNRYCPYWRLARKLCASELLSNKKLNEAVDHRRRSIDKLIKWVEEESSNGAEEIDIGRLIFRFYFGLIGNLTLSRDVLNSESDDGPEFFEAMVKFMELATAPNVADFLPFLKWLDPDGIKKRMMREMGRCIEVATKFVNERVEERKSKSGVKTAADKDLLDILLDSQENDGKEKLTEQNIIILIMEMFLAGTETTSSALEWAMAAVMRNPAERRKLREEMDRVVGRSRTVEESDVEKLPYLQAVVKETFRLYVTTPLLPRNTREDTNYMGYLIPKDTQVIVNGWGIGRDPESWDDADAFKPERFLDSDLDYKGQHYKYIPFGSGRRICAGVSLVHRTVPVIFANLLHHFDWDLPGGQTPETLSMEEKFGLSLRRLEPLNLRANKRS